MQSMLQGLIFCYVAKLLAITSQYSKQVHAAYHIDVIHSHFPSNASKFSLTFPYHYGNQANGPLM